MEDLRDVVAAVGSGCLPPADGRTVVVPQAGERDAGVLAFTGHSVVFTDEDPEWVRAALAATGADPLAAPLSPAFLAALQARTGRVCDTVDVLLTATPLPGPPTLALRAADGSTHPRVGRARTRRDGVRAWRADGGVLVLGYGVAGRLEVSVEVDDGVRQHSEARTGTAPRPGLGHQLAFNARHLADGPVWAQVSPGNARSLRAFLAAGYVPVGAEALLPYPDPTPEPAPEHGAALSRHGSAQDPRVTQ
uniref:GNAT family N-acetyltransferase n=1 Tax=Streptomyces corallincola TaxID=2851888 RepID=UPI001FE7ACA6|nr:GNAT family N-acetyltransferase [Streptomyces corallincola]